MRSPLNAPRLALAVLFVAAGLSGVCGCYTVLKHPAAGDIDVTGGGEDRRDCYDCHRADGPAHAYDPLYTPGFGYYGDSWYPYYAYPWWYRDFWYWDQYHHNTGGGGGAADGGTLPTDGRDSSRRHLWGRGTSWGAPSFPNVMGQPGTPPASAAPTDPAASTKDDGQEGRTMKGGSGTPSQPAAQPSGSDKSKDDKKKDDKNVWGRGGKK